MKLVMTLVVRDEEEILAANLDYHLSQGVDFVIVTDHGSRDRTPEILARYERLGVAHVIREDNDAHDQGRRVTAMASQAASEFGADWLIHNDADEFWWPQLGSLKDVLGAVPAHYGQIAVTRRNFLPRPDDSRPFYERMTLREAHSLNPSGGTLEPKVSHRASPEVIVDQGNHSIQSTRLRPAPDGNWLEVFHFPMRSYEQFERKVIQTGTGYEHFADRGAEVGRDQLKLLDIHREGRLREYFASRLLGDEEVARELTEGRLVHDLRLARHLRNLEADRGLTRPDSERAAQLVSDSLGRAAESERLRDELADERARCEQAIAHAGGLKHELGHLRALAEDLERRRVAVDSELDETRHALNLLRNSRLVRWSAPARRLVYRIRSR